MKRFVVAALLLGACSNSGGINSWIEALGTDKAVPAFSQLDQSQDAAVFDALLEGTHHPRARVRAQCARLLGRKRDVTAISALRALLTDPDGSTRGQAARSLAVLADPAQVVEWLEDPQAALPARAALAQALVDEQLDEVYPLLRGWLADPQASLGLRLAGCTALLRGGPCAHAGEVALALARRRENDIELRSLALELYGSQTQQAAVPELSRWLKQPGDRLQEGALAALGRTQAASALPLLAEALKDRQRSASARVAAVRSIAALPRQSTTTALLLEALADPDCRVRRCAAMVLPCFGQEPGVQAALRQARQNETDEGVEKEIDRTLRHLECCK